MGKMPDQAFCVVFKQDSYFANLPVSIDYLLQKIPETV